LIAGADGDITDRIGDLGSEGRRQDREGYSA